jgi:diguanylate cyclase (GGDEF)-like protein
MMQGARSGDNLPPARPLSSVTQVHALAPQEAARHLPVRLRGVVTAFSGWRDYFFFQDSTGGLAINREEHTLVHVGDEVELTGVSDPGLFSTSVISKEVRVLGPGRMPSTRRYNYSELEGGSKDAEWVEVRGIVHSAQVETIWDKQVLVLSVDIGGGLISLRIANFNPEDGERFVDAEIRVAGVCGTAFNDKRQFTGLRMFVPTSGAIKIQTPAPVDPYAAAAGAVRGVMQAGSQERTGHRVKIEGVVTYQDRGRSLYLQDGSDGILVSTTQDEMVPIGTRIEAVGFPALGEYSPVLKDASFRVVGGGDLVAPVSIHAADFLQYKDTFAYAPYDGQLVRLRGRVVSPLALPNEDAWLLRDGEGDFTISLRRGAHGRALAKIANGSTMSVTGVMAVNADSDHQPESFRVLLRSPSDLEIVERAPWWTPLHLMVVLIVVLVVMLAGVLWTMLLRRQVKQQTRLLTESEGRFRCQAQQDALTGVASRSFLHERLDAAVLDSRATGSMMALLMLDLDHFKQVNDTMGHQAGDELLCIVAHRIRSTVRKGDVVARMGGDEFVVLLIDVGDESMAESIGSKMVANIAVPAEIAGVMREVSASVGVCTYPAGGRDSKALLQHVDEAMYRAKARGRNSCCLYTRA